MVAQCCTAWSVDAAWSIFTVLARLGLGWQFSRMLEHSTGKGVTAGMFVWVLRYFVEVQNVDMKK
jgi:hypothetical protein